tara:strand:- start:615 stop:824 length:210 start_codon:yes stop_codon:yes gene_type:complete
MMDAKRLKAIDDFVCSLQATADLSRNTCNAETAVIVSLKNKKACKLINELTQEILNLKMHINSQANNSG